jgi:hypothetical protein
MNKQIIKLCMLGTILLSSSPLFCATNALLEQHELSELQKSAIKLFCQGMPATANKQDAEHVIDGILNVPEENLTLMFLTVGCQLTQGMEGENIRFIIEDISKNPNLLIGILKIFDKKIMQNLNRFAEPNDIVGLIRDLPFMKQDMWKMEIDRLIHIGRKKNS